jgi:hypothetical protein
MAKMEHSAWLKDDWEAESEPPCPPDPNRPVRRLGQAILVQAVLDYARGKYGTRARLSARDFLWPAGEESRERLLWAIHAAKVNEEWLTVRLARVRDSGVVGSSLSRDEEPGLVP